MSRKNSQKHLVPSKSKLKKDPGVPKLPDLKSRQARRDRSHPVTQAGAANTDSVMASEPTLSTLAALASSSDIHDEPTDPSFSQQKTKEQIRRHYVRALHKVIDESDIVILVLDARDPEGCRSRLVEEEVRRRENEGKKLVFVLNKIDLVPRENAQQWLRYLRHSTPTLPFRSTSSNQRSNLSSSTAPGLLRLLKAYKPSAAQSITVGVVGFPNVGKSSLINSLKRSKVCAVAAQPGHTKELQSIQLERGIRIVDSPGVVFEDEDEGHLKGRSKGSILLRNVVKVEDIEDPPAVVEEILARSDHETIQKIYNLPAFGTTSEFLTMLALSSGRLLKGGTPDIVAAARHVLMDWNHQKIPFFSMPPTVHPSSIPTTLSGFGSPTVAPGAETVGQAQILAELGKPFELAGLFGAADAGAFGSGTVEDEIMEDERSAQESAQEPYMNDPTMNGNNEAVMQEDVPLPLRSNRKRSRSPSVTTESLPALRDQKTNDSSLRAPKRLRRNKDLSAYDDALSGSNPLSRRALKKEAKRARKLFRKARQVDGSPEMAMDDLGSTFMVIEQ